VVFVHDDLNVPTKETGNRSWDLADHCTSCQPFFFRGIVLSDTARLTWATWGGSAFCRHQKSCSDM